MSFARYATQMTVAQDGTGDFTTIQKAIDSCKAFPDKRITIYVKNGIYNEKIRVPSWNTQLSIIGESIYKTIISYNDFFAKINRGRNSTFFTYTLLVEADDFIMENIAVENTSGPVGQAVALHVEGDRCVFLNCRFSGNQDTVYAAGKFSRQYFLNCFIEGTTDFIFGEATVVFDNCTIHCKSDSYITAASTPEGKLFGFVFLNCKLTAADQVTKVYLGRPWRSFAKAAFVNCEMGAFIRPEGWHFWSDKDDVNGVKFTEYNNYGPGAVVSHRVAWSQRLSNDEASKYSKENIFAPISWEIASGKKWYDQVIK
jgi:pectinesterase